MLEIGGREMCPNFSEGVCRLKEEAGQVPETMVVYYCRNKQYQDAYLGCPTYKEEENK